MIIFLLNIWYQIKLHCAYEALYKMNTIINSDNLPLSSIYRTQTCLSEHFEMLDPRSLCTGSNFT